MLMNTRFTPHAIALIRTFAVSLIVVMTAGSSLAVQSPALTKGVSSSVVGDPAKTLAAHSISRVRRPAKLGILDLEDAVARAELIVVVRLLDMTEAKVVHGGKTEVITQQFRFEPVRTIKGIFARDVLLLTGQDLGVYQFAQGPDRLEAGQLLLLLLGRQGPGYFNCNTSGSLEQSIPRLRNLNDPLLPAVEALILVTQKRDRADKVTTLLKALQKAESRDAAPLMISLRRRAVIAAQTAKSAEFVIKFLNDPSTEIREVAAQTLASLLDADYLNQRELHERAVNALVTSLDASGSDLAVRIAALDALGAAGETARSSESARAWLQADRVGTTFAEHAARLRAIGRSGRADQRDAIARFLGQLPLDAPEDIQTAASRALAALDPREAAQLLLKRLISKSDAGLGFAPDLAGLGDLPLDIAVPALLEAFNRIEKQVERATFAAACVKVTDPRLVPALSGLLDPRYSDVRWHASEALRKIDTDESARALWPYLGQETNLFRKLELAGFLGRHGFRGGYPYAIEHMSAPQLQDVAIDALAAIREPKAVPELRKIWESSNDLGWNAAAIRALGRLGQTDIIPRLLELARDRRNPLAAPALIALGDLGETKALPLVLDGLGSRSDEIVIAALRTARRMLDKPEIKSDKICAKIAALLADPDATQIVRGMALTTLVELDDPHLNAAMLVAFRDGLLESSDLMKRIEDLLAARRVIIETK